MPVLPGADSLLHPVHVLRGHPRVRLDVRLHRQQRADPGSRLVPGAPAGLQQLRDLAVLLVQQQRQVPRRVHRHRQHPVGQVVRELLAEHSGEHLVEQRDAGAGMQVEHLLGHLVEPVLLVVAHGVDRAQRAGVGLGQLDLGAVGGELHARLEPQRPAQLRVEDRHPGLDECSLEQHLERVLEAQEHLGDAALLVR